MFISLNLFLYSKKIQVDNKIEEKLDMELKDWIVMLVPIAINGIILFVFQILVKNHSQGYERKRIFENELLKQLYQKVQDLDIGKFDFRLNNIDMIPKKETIDKENLLMNELLIFQKGNYFQFRIYEKYIDALDELWKSSVSTWDKLQRKLPEMETDLKNLNAIKREHAEIIMNYYKLILDWQRCANTLKSLIIKHMR